MNFDDNSAALQVIRFINGTNRSIFLTGKAGTGKTTLLKNIVEHTHKSVVIVAPTGIAALNAGGVTIHSMFQLPPACYAPALNFEEEEIPFAVLPLKKVPKEVSKMAGWKRGVLRKMELLVIDEVSMLRADLLDAIDTALRSIRRRRDLAFGGVQVLFIGDMLQLPPVVKNDEWNFLKQYYQSMYFFDARVLQAQQPLVLELEKIYRQDDKLFIEILNNLRNNKFIQKDINELNKHYIPNFEAPKKQPYIFITTHNKKAEALNDKKLRELKTRSVFYSATISGTFPENLYPLNPTMEMKEGAQIMFIKNDYQQGENYYNGKIGQIHKLQNDEISVIFPETGQIVNVDLFTWENVRYTLNKETGQITEEILGTFTAYPIKLAWAVTVHKSQGLTFKRAIIDVSEAFAPGQIYVALSRLESLNGLVLSEAIVDDFPDQDKRVLQFTNDKKDEQELESLYKIELQKYVEQSVLSTFDFQNLIDDYHEHLADYDVEEDNRSSKHLFKADMEALEPKVLNIVDVAKKFSVQLRNLINHHDNKMLRERVAASIGYFEPLFNEISIEIYTIVAKAAGKSKTKQYIIDLQNLELIFFNTENKIKKCLRLLESIVLEQQLTKENLDIPIDLEARKQMFLLKVEEKKKSKKKKTKYDDKKLDTKEITYLLYSDGNSIKEIAEERGLTRITIAKHLAYYIAEGEIDVTDFVPKKEVKIIAETIKKHHTNSLSELREYLPDVTYENIRFVLAAMESGNI